jgi:sugar phosphate isomerase/epimerase
MTLNLTCGSIGVQANQRGAIELAAKHGFESVEAMPGDLAKLSDTEMAELSEWMKSKKVVFGAAGLPVDFRGDDARFEEGLRSLPRAAAALQRAGVTRMGTWLSPSSNSLTYIRNFRQHKERLGKMSAILADHGLRLGLEYVGTKTSRVRARYEFIHSMAETKDLIAEVGAGNIGFVLDTWHWWQANDTVEDILSLRSQDVVAVDLNDAPQGLEKDQQLDGKRELPAATGVIDARGFLTALKQIGYDGPVRAEPFNRPLNDLDNDAACAQTIAALRKAFAML